MKQIYLVVLALLTCSMTFAEVPEAGKKYYVKNVDTGLYWTIDGAGPYFPVLNYLLASDPGSQYEFRALSDGYYKIAVQGPSRELYLYADGGWDVIFATRADDTDLDAAVKLIPSGDGYKFSFKSHSGNVIGIDFSTPGARLFSDKGDGSHPVYVLEEVPDVITLGISTLFPTDGATNAPHTDDLVVAFNSIITLAAGATVSITKTADGTAVGGVTLKVDKNLLSITHAAFDPKTSYTVNIPEGAVTGFSSFTWTFTTSAAALTPTSGHSYKIQLEETDTYLTLAGDWDGGAWTNTAFEDKPNQKFEFTATPDNNRWFFVKDLDGYYFRAEREGRTKTQSDGVIFRYEVEGPYIKLINIDTDEYLGPYGVGPGNWVHFKTKGETHQNWKLIDLDPDVTAIASPDLNKVNVRVSGKEVFIKSALKEAVTVYSINGSIVKQTTDTHFTLNQGLYIVKAGTQRVKVIIK